MRNRLTRSLQMIHPVSMLILALGIGCTSSEDGSTKNDFDSTAAREPAPSKDDDAQPPADAGSLDPDATVESECAYRNEVHVLTEAERADQIARFRAKNGSVWATAEVTLSDNNYSHGFFARRENVPAGARVDLAAAVTAAKDLATSSFEAFDMAPTELTAGTFEEFSTRDVTLYKVQPNERGVRFSFTERMSFDRERTVTGWFVVAPASTIRQVNVTTTGKRSAKPFCSSAPHDAQSPEMLAGIVGVELVAFHFGDFDPNPADGFPKNLGGVVASDVTESELALYRTTLDPEGMFGDAIDSLTWRYRIVHDKTSFELQVDVTTGKLVREPRQLGFYGTAH